jgi:DNA mismatch repair endonuclease MutH
MDKTYSNKDEVLKQGQTIKDKSLREIIPSSELNAVETKIQSYEGRRKGHLGELIEWYVFGKKPDNSNRADFNVAGVELKTTPLKKHARKKYSSKERLVFSMIDYDKVANETWDQSSFLKKNKNLLLMFYLWLKELSILDYEFKFIYPLNLLEDISSEDIYQIQKDWEFIVAKIKRGEAHLLSEGDTYYLGACTKAANSFVLRDQPMNRILAKPRAFSFKQQYINYIIQNKLLKNSEANTDSIFKTQRRIETVEERVKEIFSPYIGMTDGQILSRLGSNLEPKSKSYKRLIVNRIFGVSSNKIEELEKANVTVKAVTLEATGILKESISFPAFDYMDLVNQSWPVNKDDIMADFHFQLETKKFLFVVFQKQKGSDRIKLKKTLFWNFPMKDIGEAERVWKKTIDCIRLGKYTELPKISESSVAHVRPHGKNSKDTVETPQKTQEVKRCFWLNSKYIQQAIEHGKN